MRSRGRKEMKKKREEVWEGIKKLEAEPNE